MGLVDQAAEVSLCIVRQGMRHAVAQLASAVMKTWAINQLLIPGVCPSRRVNLVETPRATRMNASQPPEPSRPPHQLVEVTGLLLRGHQSRASTTAGVGIRGNVDSGMPAGGWWMAAVVCTRSAGRLSSAR